MKVVFDLDGTLADESHRAHHIETKDWESYFSQMSYDSPVIPILRLYQALFEEGHTLEIWTGRPETYREQTIEWLHFFTIEFHDLKMRPKENFLPNLYLKKKWLEVSSPKPNLFIDDNKRIIDYMRSQGIVCLSAGDNDY